MFTCDAIKDIPVTRKNVSELSEINHEAYLNYLRKNYPIWKEKQKEKENKIKNTIKKKRRSRKIKFSNPKKKKVSIIKK